MRKRIGFKHLSLSISTPDGEELALKLQELLWGYLDEMRRDDPARALDLAMFMLYCTYVSRNLDEYDLFDFDADYTVENAPDNIGNKYLAADFVTYYAGLCADNSDLLDLRGHAPSSADLTRAIASWARMLDEANLSLMEGPNGNTAKTVHAVLTGILTDDVWGKVAGELTSSQSVAKLVVELADVEDGDVLDFACGNGVFLASALARGARTARGSDVDARAVLRASLLCFFAGGGRAQVVELRDALTAPASVCTAQRVIVAPPFGNVLRKPDALGEGYPAGVLGALLGKDAPWPKGFEDFCIASALDSLAEGGIAVLHVSSSFLFHQQKGRRVLRQALVEGGMLRTVIELPGGCVPGTTVQSALLVIVREPSEDGVLIVDFGSKELDGKGYVAKGRGRCDITDAGVGWLAGVVRKREEVPLVSTVVGRERIFESGSNLCYSAYGDVFDYGSVLAGIRSAGEITAEIEAVQASLESLGGKIAGILESIEKEGR